MFEKIKLNSNPFHKPTAAAKKLVISVHFHNMEGLSYHQNNPICIIRYNLITMKEDV